MQYLSKDGTVCEGQALSDLQRNTQVIEEQTKIIKRGQKIQIAWLVFAVIVFIFIVLLVRYIDVHNMYSNYVNACIR